MTARNLEEGYLMRNYEANGGENKMMAVVTSGNGGYEKLEYRAVPIPVPGPGEVLLRVLAAGINNTEINTRLGWYSSSVTTDTSSTSEHQETEAEQKTDGGWNKATPFPPNPRNRLLWEGCPDRRRSCSRPSG